MGFFKSLLLCILLFNLTRRSEVDGDCILKLDPKYFGTPAPVYLRNGNYLLPDPKDGVVRLRRSDTVTVACPGGRNYVMLGNDTTGKEVVEAHCIVNQTFRIETWIGEFNNVKCKTQPWFMAEDSKSTCHAGSKIYRVGYKIQNRFYKLYESCFDQNIIVTHYVTHYMSSENAYLQKNFVRPPFLEGNLFGKIKMSSLYKIDKQKQRLDAILGPNMGEKYISQKQSLTRGHLAARADFPMHAQSRATFHYINTAPQWKRGNAGDWAALEEALRRRILAIGVNVTVFTGTYGVMTLPDMKGRMREIYLHTDENNNGVVPVPMYYYKVVYDPQSYSATAFVSINSSFYNNTVLEDLTFCNDICGGNKKFNWLTWRANDGTFSFCCEYAEFAETVGYLPIKRVVKEFY